MRSATENNSDWWKTPLGMLNPWRLATLTTSPLSLTTVRHPPLAKARFSCYSRPGEYPGVIESTAGLPIHTFCYGGQQRRCYRLWWSGSFQPLFATAGRRDGGVFHRCLLPLSIEQVLGLSLPAQRLRKTTRAIRRRHFYQLGHHHCSSPFLPLHLHF